MRQYMLSMMVVAMVMAAFGSASADTPVSFGAQVDWADDFDLGIGARAVLGTSEIVENSRAVASFDFYFPDDGGSQVDLTFWELNFNGLYDFDLETAPVDFYAGAGLHFAHVSFDIDLGALGSNSVSDTEVGLNVLGGILFSTSSSLAPFVELKIELGGAEQFILTGGLTF